MKIKDEALKYAEQVLGDIVRKGELSPPHGPSTRYPLATVASAKEALDRVITALAAPNEPPKSPPHAPLKPEEAPLLERAEWLMKWLQWSDHRGCYYQANIVHALIEALKANGVVDGDVIVLPHVQHPAPAEAMVAPQPDPGPTLGEGPAGEAIAMERTESTRVGVLERTVRERVYSAPPDQNAEEGTLTRTLPAIEPQGALSGGRNSYWLVPVLYPQREDQDPYNAECEDIIEALEMTPNEANEFKAIWRTAGQRMGNGKPGGDALYDAEKRAHYAQRDVRRYRRLKGAQ